MSALPAWLHKRECHNISFPIKFESIQMLRRQLKIRKRSWGVSLRDDFEDKNIYVNNINKNGLQHYTVFSFHCPSMTTDVFVVVVGFFFVLIINMILK